MKKKIALIQMNVEFANPEKNRKKIEAMIEEAVKGNPDILCLPETWNVGFFPRRNLTELSDVDGYPSKDILSRLAQKYKVNIVGGSITNNKDNKIYNTAYIFNRKGECIGEYDKIHGYSPSGENVYFQGGKEICIFELDGIKAGVIICYDIRFLELTRILALKGIQILFVPAQWPHPRANHWKTLSIARAIENQIFIASINGVGVTEEAELCGNSMIINPWGEILANGEEKEGIVTAEVDFSIVKDMRRRINVFEDRKPQLYESWYKVE